MDYVSKIVQTSARNIGGVGLALMTKKKAVDTEVVEGAGASARLVLILKAGTTERLQRRDPQRQAVAGAHLQARE